MKELLIVTFCIIVSTSLQKELESPGDLCPAEIFLANSRVKEGQEVRFKCKVADVQTRKVYMLFCKNGATVRTAELEQSDDDKMFVIGKVTVEDSGLYTCSYTVGQNATCKNTTGHKSIPLEVVGEILPAKITAAQSSLVEGEDLTLTCSTTVNQSCAEVYVYLCLNGIGKISRTVTCSINLTTETFLLTNVKQEDSGDYSCVYSTSNHSLSEVIKTGGNTVHIQVHDSTPGGGQTAVIIPLLVVAAALVLGMFVIHKYRDTITLRLCRNPGTSSSLESVPYYYSFSPGAHPVDHNEQPPSAGEPGNSATITYAKVQKCKGKDGKNAESFDSSGAAPAVYSLVMHCEEKTELPKDCYAEVHNTAKQVAWNDMYAHYSTQVDYN